MLNPLLQVIRRALRMPEQQGPATGASNGGSVRGTSSARQADQKSSDDRIDDHARRLLQSMHTSPSEVTIGMIRQTNGCLGPSR